MSLTSPIHTCKKINYTSCSLLYKFISYIIFITLYKFTSTEYFMGGGKGRKGHDYTKMTLVRLPRICKHTIPSMIILAGYEGSDNSRKLTCLAKADYVFCLQCRYLYTRSRIHSFICFNLNIIVQLHMGF